MKNQNEQVDTPLLRDPKVMHSDSSAGLSLHSYQNSESDDYESLLPPSSVTSTPSSSRTEASSSLTKRRRLIQGRILLFVVALIYGSLNVSLRMVYERPGPPTASVLSTTRGWMAVICFGPLLRFVKPHDCNNNNDLLLNIDDNQRQYMFMKFIFELAVYNFGTQALQNLGLISVESARVAFLTQLSVVITPVISAALGNKVHFKVWIACLIALMGLYILSNTNAYGFNMHFSTGDLCCLLSACCWSCYIYRMSAWGEYFDETLTQFYKNIVLASMYGIWMCISMYISDISLWEGWTDPISWLVLFYSALGPCTMADIIQQRAQGAVPAAESNVILSLEPVFTALLGLILLGEILSWQEVVGGGLIIGASILASY